MSKIAFTRLPLALLLGTALSLAACQKDEETTLTTEEAESAEVNALLEEEYAAVSVYVEDAAAAEPRLDARVASPENLPDCASFSYSSDTRTLIIDFGDTNCTCRDGRQRRGKIITVFDGERRTAGASASTTLENYFVDGVQFTGTMVRTYQGNYTTRVVVTGASAITETGTATWNSERTVQQISGTDTYRFSDDVWTITGSYTGVNRRGVAYTAATEQPLKRVLAIGCARNFVSGIINIENENGNTLRLNYDPTGKEPCDNLVEVSLNGHTRLVSLR